MGFCDEFLNLLCLVNAESQGGCLTGAIGKHANGGALEQREEILSHIT